MHRQKMVGELDGSTDICMVSKKDGETKAF
jgi:hypothetical protein